MADSNKRKERPKDITDSRGLKRSKGGSGGKWQTPHQLAKRGFRKNDTIEPGDAGIWVTCAKNQERRATEELKGMFEECAERFYGIKPAEEDFSDEDESVDDIESSIEKEVASMNNKQGQPKLFSTVPIDLPCVLFFKVRPQIDPVDFVYRICKEIVSTPGIRRMKYVNRLTPVTMIGRATEKGLDELGKVVLGKQFQISGEDGKDDDDDSAPSYAIRPTTRAHNTLQRGAVIKQVAEMVGSRHKVDLTNPEKVIIVEIYQTICGMCVVESDWETLKRFNLAELYRPAPKPKPEGPQAAFKAEAIPKTVPTGEFPPAEDAFAPRSTDTLVPSTSLSSSETNTEGVSRS